MIFIDEEHFWLIEWFKRKKNQNKTINQYKNLKPNKILSNKI